MRELMQMGKGREWDSETHRESLAATRYKQRLLQFRRAQRGHEAYTQVMMPASMFLSLPLNPPRVHPLTLKARGKRAGGGSQVAAAGGGASVGRETQGPHSRH